MWIAFRNIHCGSHLVAIKLAAALCHRIYIHHFGLTRFVLFQLTFIHCRNPPMWRYLCITFTLNTPPACAPRGGGVRTAAPSPPCPCSPPLDPPAPSAEVEEWEYRFSSGESMALLLLLRRYCAVVALAQLGRTCIHRCSHRALHLLAFLFIRTEVA